MFNNHTRSQFCDLQLEGRQNTPIFTDSGISVDFKEVISTSDEK